MLIYFRLLTKRKRFCAFQKSVQYDNIKKKCTQSNISLTCFLSRISFRLYFTFYTTHQSNWWRQTKPETMILVHLWPQTEPNWYKPIASYAVFYILLKTFFVGVCTTTILTGFNAALTQLIQCSIDSVVPSCLFMLILALRWRLHQIW